MEWWLARGREVIAGDEGVWQSLMNVTMWDCFRSYVAGHVADAERSTKIRELLCKKRIDVGAGQVLEWRVNYPGKTDVKPQ